MKRVIQIGIIIVIIVLVGGVIFALVRSRSASTTSNTNNAVNTNTTTGRTTNGNTTVTNVNTTPSGEQPVNARVELDEESMILRTARVFIERYGTFSNDNVIEHLVDLYPFMTSRFQQETAKQSSGEIDDTYYGISTQVVALAIATRTETDAAVNITTQRVETKGEEESRRFTQEVEVQLKNDGEAWFVAGVQWK